MIRPADSVKWIGVLFGLLGVLLWAWYAYAPSTPRTTTMQPVEVAPIATAVPTVQPLPTVAPAQPMPQPAEPTARPSSPSWVMQTGIVIGSVVLVVGTGAALWFAGRTVSATLARRRHMQHTRQSAAMFMEASDPETRAANERIIAQLAASGVHVPGFTEVVTAAPEAPPPTRDLAVLLFLAHQGATGATAEQIHESVGGGRTSLYRLLTKLARAGHIQQDGHGKPYQLTDAGHAQVAQHQATIAARL